MSRELRKKRRSALPIYAKIPAFLVFIICLAAFLTLAMGIYTTVQGIPFSGEIVGFSFNARSVTFFAIIAVAAYTFTTTLFLFTGLSQNVYWHLGGLALIEAASFTLLLYKDMFYFVTWQFLILPQALGLLHTHKKRRELSHEIVREL